MPMTNEDLSIGFAALQERVNSIAATTTRIEDSLTSVTALSKTLAELVVLYGVTKEDIGDLRGRVQTCSASHEASTRALQTKTDTLAAELIAVSNRAKALLLAVVFFVPGFSAGGYAAGQWLFEMAMNNAKNNATQQITIDSQERILNEIRQEIKK